MKSRLNITVDAALVEQAKRYAAKNKTSISRLIEQYFKALTSRPSRKKNVLELLDEYPKPKGNLENYSKDSYYEERKNKYGS